MRQLMYMLSIGLCMESSSNVYTHVMIFIDIYSIPAACREVEGDDSHSILRLGDMISMRALLTVLHGRTP